MSETVKVEVVGLGGRGDGVARLGGGEVVMIAGAAPGDVLQVRLEGRRAGVRRGKIVAVLREGEGRTTPFCPIFGRCGGCAWQHVALPTQRSEKLALATRALARLGMAPRLVPTHMVSAAGERTSRRRARWHLRDVEGGVVSGFLAWHSDRVVATDRCPVLDPALGAVMLPLRRWLDGRVRAAEVHAVFGTQGVIAEVSCRPQPDALPPKVDAAALDELGLVGVSLRFGTTCMVTGLQEVTLPETAGPLPVTTSAAGFCQANAAANTAIREEVRGALAAIVAGSGPLNRVQEVFSGSGNLGFLLAGVASEVCMIERNPQACARARRTLEQAPPGALGGTRFEVICADANRAMDAPVAGELLLLDPGRAGAREICTQVAAAGPRHVIYVSCAFDTLARDLRLLTDAGLVLRSAVVIDAFPHTPHMELVVRLGPA